MKFSLSEHPLAENLLGDDPAAGARVVFVGQVRDENLGRKVTSLEYEAYGELAVQEGERILHEARQTFSIRDAACVHRTGHLQIGEAAIRVEVLAGHRGEAFEACRWIVDQMKSRVPIWKREHYDEGVAEWADPRT
jgi:molybdopterin synthase catalytic subunit